tara:strand:- start:192 stop:374 length:183 start_codon:yes stop_codon:yes gene_type:complete
MNYTFKIYFSQQYNLYDLTILKNNKFNSHYHLTENQLKNTLFETIQMNTKETPITIQITK